MVTLLPFSATTAKDCEDTDENVDDIGVDVKCTKKKNKL